MCDTLIYLCMEVVGHTERILYVRVSLLRKRVVSIVVSIPACHVGDPGSIPATAVMIFAGCISFL